MLPVSLTPKASLFQTPSFDGALDVRDENDVAAGEYVSRSMGGYTLVGSTSRKAATVSSLLRNPYHALLLGQAGETGSRLALDHDGAVHWGDGKEGGFQATMTTKLSAREDWPAVALSPAGVHTAVLALQGGAPADICACSHDGLGAAVVQLTCSVANSSSVQVVLRNADAAAATHVAAGTVLAVLTRYS